jgi:hypothetical protein
LLLLSMNLDFKDILPTCPFVLRKNEDWNGIVSEAG